MPYKARAILFALFFTSYPGFARQAFAQHAEERESEKQQADPSQPAGAEPSEAASGQFAPVVEGITQRTNEFRRENSLDPLKVSEKLQAAAAEFAQYMARTDTYGHTADGRRPAERAEAQGYEYCLIAENIAYQYRSTGFSDQELAEAFVTGWKESPGHRENMLKEHATQIGVGVARSDKTGYYYGVQMFGRPQSASIEFEVANRAGEMVQYIVGNRTYPLPPRYTRTHHRCRPTGITFATGNQAEKVFDLKDGDRYTVTTSPQAGLQIERN